LPAMRVVVGWVASRNDLALDQFDDITLALETLVAGEANDGSPISLTVSVSEGTVHLLLEGLQNRSLQANLQARESTELSAAWPLDIRLFLGALVDTYKVVAVGPQDFGVEMRKRIS
jgi:hypothetical protein